MTNSAKTGSLALVLLLGCAPAGGDQSTMNADTSESGDGDGDGDGDPVIYEGCEAIVNAQTLCGREANSAEYCSGIVEDHPATGDQAACTQAMLDRVTCYSELPCEDLAACDLWGCVEPEPCPEQAAAVEAACIRTACEQWFDQATACGATEYPGEPGYCEYLKYLEALTADDWMACVAAYDVMVECFASLDCADFDKCEYFDQACEQGFDGCQAERVAYDQACL